MLSDPSLATFPDPAVQEEPSPSKREALMRAALELFAERTYGSTPVPDIAARAHVGTGTVYRHFQSKEELANAVYRACKSAMLEAVVAAGALGGSIEERFLRMWNALAAMAAADPRAIRFLEMQHHQEYLDEESRALSYAAFSAAEGLMRDGQATGDVCDADPSVLIALAWGAFVGLFKEAHLGRFVLDEHKVSAAGARAWRMVAA